MDEMANTVVEDGKRERRRAYERKEREGKEKGKKEGVAPVEGSPRLKRRIKSESGRGGVCVTVGVVYLWLLTPQQKHRRRQTIRSPCWYVTANERDGDEHMLAPGIQYGLFPSISRNFLSVLPVL
jgi:hypothetical protein